MKEIAFVTDIHLDEPFPKSHGVDARRNWRAILQDISSKKIRDVVFGGDIGELSSNQWFFKTLENYRLNVVLGNHDSFSEVMKYCKIVPENNKELFYVKEDKFIKYLFMDSSAAALSLQQLQWLKGQLNTDKKILFFIHHPILAIDSPVDRNYPLTNREQIRPLLLQKNGEVIVICGHYHTSDATVEGNIRQLITPAGSYQIRKHTQSTEVVNNSFGYRILSINKENVETELIMFNV